MIHAATVGTEVSVSTGGGDARVIAECEQCGIHNFESRQTGDGGPGDLWSVRVLCRYFFSGRERTLSLAEDALGRGGTRYSVGQMSAAV